MPSKTTAQGINKIYKKESAEVDVDIFMYLFVDGLIDNTTQKITSDRFRGVISEKVKTLNDNAVSSGESIFEYTNPKAEPGDDNIEDNLHIHCELHYDLPAYGKASYIKYQRIIKRIKNDVKKKANGICSNSNVQEARLHIYLLLYNQGPIISSIIGAVLSEEEDNIHNKISDLIGNPYFLENKKIKYKQIEYIALVDIIGSTSELAQNSVGFTTGASDYGIISSRELVDSIRDRHCPTKQDILDAVVMCQHTYDSQSAIDQSVYNYAINEAKGLLGTPDTASTISEISRILLGAYNPSFPSLDFGPFKVSQEMMNLVLKKFMREDETVGKDLKRSSRPITIDVEKDDKKYSFCANWEVVSAKEISSTLLNGKTIWLKNYATGFYSQLYKKIDENKYAYCTCGTNFTSPADWIFTNILQGLTGISPQYSESVHVAKILDKAIHDKGDGVLLFIGHSLGGGLASNNALVTKKRHAITFNAAGLHPYRVLGTLLVNNFKDLFHPIKRKEKIHAFVLDGEILNWLLGPIGEPAYGTMTKIKINDNNEALKELKGKSAKHAMTNFLFLKDELLNAIKGKYDAK